MLKRLTVLLVLAALLVGMLSVVSAQDAVKVGPITQRILDRKKLICGVSTGTPGFTVINSDGIPDFHQDFCNSGLINANIRSFNLHHYFSSVTSV